MLQKEIDVQGPWRIGRVEAFNTTNTTLKPLLMYINRSNQVIQQSVQ